MIIFAIVVALIAGIFTNFLPKKYSSSVDFYIINTNTSYDYTTSALLVDVLLQLGRGERLLLVLADEQVVGFYLHDGVHLQAVGNMLQRIGNDAVLPVLGLP